MEQKLSSITKRPGGVHAPLSLAQRRLWFLYQLDSQSPEYNISRAWRLKGSLNTEALATSLNLIHARHEILRTTFQEIDGQPIQVIQPTLTAPFQERDCSSYSPAQLEAEIDRFLIDEPFQPFDLLTGPLLRFTLMRCNPDDHVLVFTVHHIVFDGTSLKNFCQELSLCYTATLAGQPSPLAPLPIQYQDYSYWQQGHVTDEKLASQLTYWKQQLQGAPLILELPSDFSRPKEKTGPGSFQAFTLPHQVISSLKQLIQPQGITVFMALLAVFQILLIRYTDQRDILVGTPIAGRTHTDLEDLIGFLVNTLVLRTQIVGQPTFHEVLRQVRKTCLKAYQHQDLPFEKLVEILKPVRDPSRYPVVQAIFQLRQLSDLCLSFPGIVAHPLPVKKQTGNFDLHMVCQETKSGIEGFLYYPQNLFSDTMMGRFANHYQILLERLVANPQRPINQISFLTDAEYHQQIIEWNNTATVYPHEASLPALFEAQVAERPEAVAIVCGDEQLTYSQLNQRANQLAHYLQGQGVGPEVRVGVCLERSVDLIVSLLAILKAGGAYVPLDPTYPEERLHYIVKDAALQCIVTQHGLVQGLEETDCPRIYQDGAEDFLTQSPVDNPVSANTRLNLAYLIYTSGSTGHPKGVMVPHEAVVNLLLTLQEGVAIDPTSVVLAVTNYSFDISVVELLGSLIAGGHLVLTSREVAMDGAALLAVVESHGITVLQATPTSWRMLLQVSEPSSKESLNIISGGEPMTTDLGHRLQPWGSTIWNMYGPTETTIYSTLWAVKGLNTQMSIGRPLANTSIFLVDKAGELVPIGVPGEILIGGDGVTRGYHQRPDLTAKKFIPDPFSPNPGKRLYKTGDLARYRVSGDLEYLQRLDHQVKLRGYRIELSEIEKVLGQHPGVQNAVVLCREDSPDEKQLVAYVMSASETTLEPATLRTYLKTRVPDYMLPAPIVMVDDLPLTSNGKVNRQALPLPEQTHRTQATISVSPRTPLEEHLAEIWGNLLKTDHIGVHDNFFDIGGHSLLATRVVARLRHVLELDLPVRTLFEHPTVAQLAIAIDTHLAQAFPDWPQNES